jgi:hypothetical protein
MRKCTLPFAFAAVAAATAAVADDTALKDLLGPIDVAVFGDSPYGVDAPYGGKTTDTAQLVATPAFIDFVNADPSVSLVLHVGDIHSGKQNCTLAYDQNIYNLWTAFAHPLVYVPGDNEWSDCHKVGEGGGAYDASQGKIVYDTNPDGTLTDYAGGDPLANLTLVRQIFFSNLGQALAQRKFVLSQAFAYDRRHPSDAKFVENVIWEQARVLFVTLNIPGGSNNDQDIWYGTPTLTAAQIQEIAERTDADIRWLNLAFELAKITRAKGVVIQSQADMWDPEKGPAHQLGFEGVFGLTDSNYGFVQGVHDAKRDIVGEIAKQVSSFGGPVLMFNGDSHVFRSENPLQPSSDCVVDPGSGLTAVPCTNDDWLQHPNAYPNVSKFHRVVVHGSTTPLEYLKLTIDPRANAAPSAYAIGPFSWQRVIQH